MGIYLIEIVVPTKSVLHTGQPFMYSRYGSKGDIFPPLANNRVTVGYPVLLEGSLLHPGFSRMYGQANLIRPIVPIVCSANHDARLPISAIQIRIKQYKFNKHLFWMPQASISTSDYRQRDPAAGGSSQISKAFQNL